MVSAGPTLPWITGGESVKKRKKEGGKKREWGEVEIEKLGKQIVSKKVIKGLRMT